jgi:tripartite-type tricarboxylate transporter receptor subunit TctC
MSGARQLSILAAVAAIVFAVPASAQEPNYPTRPIKIVVSVPAGGGVDLSARIVADALHKVWGQPVTVENRTGGGGNIAGEMVSKTEPDGYTLLATPPNIVAANAALYRQLNYEPAALEPVAILAVGPNVLAVKETSSAKTVPELIALAKSSAR